MRRFAIFVCFPVLLAGQPDSGKLLQRARANIARNLDRLPNYTCVQTVQRARFESFSKVPSSGCHVGEPGRPPLLLAWKDQLKLDVAVSGDQEIFSWAGARKFESGDVQQIAAGGLTASGDFGPFLADLFGKHPAPSQFLGWEQDHGRTLAAYSYRVPVSASGYKIKTGTRPGDVAALAYEGKFWLDAATAELVRLTIVVPEPPAESDTCRIETTIDYQRAHIGAVSLLLPKEALLKLWDTDGVRYQNQSDYASCRAFQSESVFRPLPSDSVGSPETAPRTAVSGQSTVPRGITLKIALQSPINAATAYAGDAVEGRLLRPIRVKGRVVAPEGAVVRGRIVRVEQHVRPARYWTLGLQFDALDANGAELPLHLEAIPHSHEEKALEGLAEKKEGIGMFLLPFEHPVLDNHFVSEWKTK